jgi:hypothetical protein
MSASVTGSCLCGGVRYEVKPPAVRFQYCHCLSCRKATSSAHGAMIFFPPENFRWLAGGELIERFTDEKENPGYMRWFCRTCGSAVPRFNRTRQFMLVPAGTLDGDPGVRPERSIFWDERGPWYVGPEALPKFAEGPDSAPR